MKVLGLLCIFLISRAGSAATLPDPSQLPSLNSLGLGDVPHQVVQTIGVALDHRPYQPATPLGTAAGVDLSIEATLVRVPDEFKAALEQAGFGSASSLPVLPSPKLHIHKGMGERTDIGVSGVFFQGKKVVGADIKVTVTDPEAEGPTVALRLTYNWLKVDWVRAITYSPQILVSRKLEFADPYIGVGWEFVTGGISYTYQTGFPPPFDTYTLAYDAKGGAGVAFLGLALRPPQIGLKLTIEGAYSTIGADTLGVKFGFAF